MKKSQKKGGQVVSPYLVNNQVNLDGKIPDKTDIKSISDMPNLLIFWLYFV
jgi:hypothetical protein